jgi:DHA1 family multidrug resistance protein-like MFS transporter
MGFTGFTLVMPFLPLFIRELGVSDVGEIALWTGFSLGVTPALNALVSPFWGQLADRLGRKIMVVRSLVACVIVMASMAYVTRAWHVLALRAILGLLTGYGGLSLTMAAELAPVDRVAWAIGTVQTAQRLGPAVGPVVGGALAAFVGLRRAFLVTAAFYAVGLLLVLFMYDERATHQRPDEEKDRGRVTFLNVLAFKNFMILIPIIFGVQFVDRSFGPILPLFIEQIGVRHDRVPLAAGIVFSIAAFAGAIGHHFCGKLLERHAVRVVIAGGVSATCLGSILMAMSPNVLVMSSVTTLFGLGVGIASTAAYTAAAAVIPSGAHGTGFGVLTSASLTGLAVSPIVAGFIGATSMGVIFIVDAAMMAGLALVVRQKMV